MDRSTNKETATKIVKTAATDHVGVNAKDRVSGTMVAIPKLYFSQYLSPISSITQQKTPGKVALHSSLLLDSFF